MFHYYVGENANFTLPGLAWPRVSLPASCSWQRPGNLAWTYLSIWTSFCWFTWKKLQGVLRTVSAPVLLFKYSEMVKQWYRIWRDSESFGLPVTTMEGNTRLQGSLAPFSMTMAAHSSLNPKHKTTANCILDAVLVSLLDRSLIGEGWRVYLLTDCCPVRQARIRQRSSLTLTGQLPENRYIT